MPVFSGASIVGLPVQGLLVPFSLSAAIKSFAFGEFEKNLLPFVFTFHF